ncbi:hypothetical protein BGZ83_001761, partial [Gryganskiella cystojenkinii]
MLSILGRSTIVNSMILSRLWHVLWVYSPAEDWMTQWMPKLRREVKKFIQGFSPSASWDTICTPRKLGGLGAIDPTVQSTSFHLKYLRRLLSDPHGIAGRVIFSLISDYSTITTPPIAFLQYLTRTERTQLNKITVVRNLITASFRLLPVSTVPTHETHLLHPVAMVLASPLSRWVTWFDTHPPLIKLAEFNLRTSDILSYNDDTS